MLNAIILRISWSIFITENVLLVSSKVSPLSLDISSLFYSQVNAKYLFSLFIILFALLYREIQHILLIFLIRALIIQ